MLTKCQATATAAPAQASRGKKEDAVVAQDFPKVCLKHCNVSAKHIKAHVKSAYMT